MTDILNTAYAEIEKRFAKCATKGWTSALIGWDARVNAPECATEGQGEQMAALAADIHGVMTTSDWPELFEKAEKIGGLNDIEQANLRECRREYDDGAFMPADLVEESAKASNAGEAAWGKAKAANDFNAFKPHLEHLLRIQRKIGKLKSEITGTSVYNALLDFNQPGVTTEKLDVLFNDLKGFLPDFIEKVRSKQPADRVAFKGKYPVERQMVFAKNIMKTMGFDFSRGRIDLSDGGAFCTTCGKDDIRIVSHFKEDDPFYGLSAAMHETGHALYEQGLPYAFMEQPVGRARGMALHESQSILMAGFVLQTDAFLNYLSAELQDFYGASEELSVDFLKQRTRYVQPSFIRITADEVTYPIHIIIRYELEKAMVEGDLMVDGLPAAWNAKMKEYLGIIPATDADGCLQDIHWAVGSFGYFPDYSVGALASAQFFAAATKQNPDMMALLGRGDFSVLKKWLNENVHSKGSSLAFDDLIEKATGHKLSTAAFKETLTQRYF